MPLDPPRPDADRGPSRPPSPLIVVRVLLPFALGYFLSYLYRTVNNVIAPDLIRDLDLAAGSLGLLTSTYFLAFAAFQLPLGVLLDRFGARRSEAVLLVFAAAGAALFAAAGGLGGLLAGRALIGFGVSACLMAAFTAFVGFFPRHRLPQINGLQMAAGSLGALAATQPVAWALAATDWRGLFWGLAVATLCVGILVWAVVPEHQRPSGEMSWGDALRGVGEVFGSVAFWRIAPLACLSQAAFLSIQSLWSGPWLADVAGLPRDGVARALLMIAAAMLVGHLGLGSLAARLSRHGVPSLTVAVAGMGLFLLVQVALVLQWTAAALPLWIAFGFFGTSGIITYASLSQTFPARLAGRVNTGLNLLVFVIAFAVQWGIGETIDLWPRAADGGFAAAGYQAAFGGVLALQGLGLAWYLLWRPRPGKGRERF